MAPRSENSSMTKMTEKVLTSLEEVKDKLKALDDLAELKHKVNYLYSTLTTPMEVEALEAENIGPIHHRFMDEDEDEEDVDEQVLRDYVEEEDEDVEDVGEDEEDEEDWEHDHLHSMENEDDASKRDIPLPSSMNKQRILDALASILGNETATSRYYDTLLDLSNTIVRDIKSDDKLDDTVVWSAVPLSTRRSAVDRLEKCAQEIGLPINRAANQWIAANMIYRSWANHVRRYHANLKRPTKRRRASTTKSSSSKAGTTAPKETTAARKRGQPTRKPPASRTRSKERQSKEAAPKKETSAKEAPTKKAAPAKQAAPKEEAAASAPAPVPEITTPPPEKTPPATETPGFATPPLSVTPPPAQPSSPSSSTQTVPPSSPAGQLQSSPSLPSTLPSVAIVPPSVQVFKSTSVEVSSSSAYVESKSGVSPIGDEERETQRSSDRRSVSPKRRSTRTRTRASPSGRRSKSPTRPATRRQTAQSKS